MTRRRDGLALDGAPSEDEGEVRRVGGAVERVRGRAAQRPPRRPCVAPYRCPQPPEGACFVVLGCWLFLLHGGITTQLVKATAVHSTTQLSPSAGPRPVVGAGGNVDRFPLLS